MSICHVTLPPPGHAIEGTCGNYLLKSALKIKDINSLFFTTAYFTKILSPQNRPISPTQGHRMCEVGEVRNRTWVVHVFLKIINLLMA